MNYEEENKLLEDELLSRGYSTKRTNPVTFWCNKTKFTRSNWNNNKEASRNCKNKIKTKELLRAVGINVPKDVALDSPQKKVRKPIRGQEARGVEVFLGAIEDYKPKTMIEEYIEGTKWRILANRDFHMSNLTFEGDSDILTVAHGAIATEHGDIPHFTIASQVIRAIPNLLIAGIDFIERDGTFYCIDVNYGGILGKHHKPDVGTPVGIVKRMIDRWEWEQRHGT